MTKIMETIPVAFIVGGGISLCIAGFRRGGLPLNAHKRITGRPARVIGIVSLILSLMAATVWIALRGAVG